MFFFFLNHKSNSFLLQRITALDEFLLQDDVSIATAISALEGQGQWKHALHLLNRKEAQDTRCGFTTWKACCWYPHGCFNIQHPKIGKVFHQKKKYKKQVDISFFWSKTSLVCYQMLRIPDACPQLSPPALRLFSGRGLWTWWSRATSLRVHGRAVKDMGSLNGW